MIKQTFLTIHIFKNMDAAFSWIPDNKIYAFKYNKIFLVIII